LDEIHFVLLRQMEEQENVKRIKAEAFAALCFPE